MKNIFNSIKLMRPKSNGFDLSHDVKLSCNMGDLVPTLCMECVPGDQFHLGCDSLHRLAPMVAPMMHRVDVSMHYFFVPARILWPNWEKFMTSYLQTGVTAPSFPTMQIVNGTGGVYTPLCDYLGIPSWSGSVSPKNALNAIPFAVYQRIWWDYYRDQNMQPDTTYPKPVLVDGDQGSQTTFMTTLRQRCWEHDYFTASLPFSQKGTPVALPIGSFGDVPVKIQPNTAGNYPAPASIITNAGAQPNITLPNTAAPNWQNVGDQSTLYAETSSLSPSGVTINTLRQATRLQEWLEKQARGGTRYIESILTHFGVRSSDKRLQRPEYITGTKTPIVVSEVLNTTGATGAPVQGSMAGHGIGATQGKYGFYKCEEHGYIMGIMSVMPKSAYQDGVPRHFLKTTDPTQYFWPEFAHLGEQGVDQREVYYSSPQALGTVFGYVPRYSEYKFQQNRVCGDFRTTLNFWHMGRIFASDPALNEAFVKADPTFRVFADTTTTDSHIWSQVLHKISAKRGMPKFGTPYL